MITVIGHTFEDIILEVEHVPTEGEGVAGRLLSNRPGAMAANTAGWAAVSGAQVVLHSSIGDDEAGHEIMAQVQEVQNLEAHFQVAGTTSKSFILVGPTGERTIIYCRAQGRISPAVSPISGIALINLGNNSRRGEWWQQAQNDACTLRVLPLMHLYDELDSGRQWDLIVGSVEDVKGWPDHEQLAEYFQRLGAAGIITDGSKGLHLFENNLWSEHAPAVVEDIVDTIGAGDSFLAGLLVALDYGLTLSQSIPVAIETAAQALRTRGGWPQLDQVGWLDISSRDI